MLLWQCSSGSPSAPPFFRFGVFDNSRGEERGIRNQILLKFHVCRAAREHVCSTKFLGATAEKRQLQICGYSKRKSLDPEPRSPQSLGAAVSLCSWKYNQFYFSFAKFITVLESGARLASGPSFASGIHEEPPEAGLMYVFWECTGLRFKGFLWTASRYIKGRQDETTTRSETWIFIQSQILWHSTPRWAHQTCSSRQNTVSQ